MSIEEKAHRYLAEGRVKVVQVGPSSATIEIQGSASRPYRVHVKGDSAMCPCEARVEKCAHVVAALLVVRVSGRPSIGESTELDDLFA
jgi:uncharacterized Zn finger protein